jgi:hypothetical protein
MAQVQATLRGLEQQGKKPHVIRDKEGTSVTGWIFESIEHYANNKSLNYSGNGTFLETWGERKTIFTVEGEFYCHDFRYSDEVRYKGGPVEEYREDRLTKHSIGWLAGTKGEPFSEIIAKLKRFPYTAYSLWRDG